MAASAVPPPTPPPPVAWDAGDLGCGDLVLELRMRFRELPLHTVFELTARDPGAPEDIPAWCRMTGQKLLSGTHPHYRIRKEV